MWGGCREELSSTMTMMSNALCADLSKIHKNFKTHALLSHVLKFRRNITLTMSITYFAA